MASMELILIRHGETDWNRETVFRGQADVRLNAAGIAEADATAEVLKDKVFEVVYSSPLKRAFVTARRIAMPHQMDVKVKQEFADINFGVWQGRKEAEIKEKYSNLYDKWMTRPDKVKFRGGESTKKAWKRVNTGLREILFTHGTGCVVVVSHRIPIKFMTAYLLGKGLADINDIRHDPCAMSVFEVQGREYTPKKLNDSSHLSRLRLGPQRDF